MTDHAMYNRQISTESGWDNPFRPDGDLSREADEIVSLIKGGKPITPTPAALLELAPEQPKEITLAYNVTGRSDQPKEVTLAYNVTATPPSSPSVQSSLSPSPAKQSPGKPSNGTKNGSLPERGGPVEVQRSQPPAPLQPEHVTIKKKPKCNCCVLQ